MGGLGGFPMGSLAPTAIAPGGLPSGADGLPNGATVKLQAPSLLPAPLPKALQSPKMTTPLVAQEKGKLQSTGPCTTTIMITARGS